MAEVNAAMKERMMAGPAKNKAPMKESHMVYFAFNSSVMAPSSMIVIGGAALSIKKAAKTTFVIGQTDASGSDSNNKAKADKRANAVMSALRKAGVKGSISMVVAGERDLAVKTKGGMKKGVNRRVEIAILREGDRLAGRLYTGPPISVNDQKLMKVFSRFLFSAFRFRKVPDFGMVFGRDHAPWIGSGAFRQHRHGFAEHIPATVYGLNKLRLVLYRFEFLRRRDT
jgi:hypothetical protein